MMHNPLTNQSVTVHASTPQFQQQLHQQVQQQQQTSTPTSSGARVTLRRASQSTITRPDGRGTKRKSPQAELQENESEVQEVTRDPLEVSPWRLMFESAILTIQKAYQDLDEKNKRACQEYSQERKGLNEFKKQ